MTGQFLQRLGVGLYCHRLRIDAARRVGHRLGLCRDERAAVTHARQRRRQAHGVQARVRAVAPPLAQLGLERPPLLTVASAPNLRASSASGVRTAPTTRAPRPRASSTAKPPTIPAAPVMSTKSPPSTAAVSTSCRAVARIPAVSSLPPSPTRLAARQAGPRAPRFAPRAHPPSSTAAPRTPAHDNPGGFAGEVPALHLGKLARAAQLDEPPLGG